MHNYEMTQQAHQVPMERTNSSTPSLKIMKTKHKPPKLKAAGKDYMDARGVLIRPSELGETVPVKVAGQRWC
jgi:hypothetical protein